MFTHTNRPDRTDSFVLGMLAILGAVLAVVALYRLAS
jgi:hypothetical protein